MFGKWREPERCRREEEGGRWKEGKGKMEEGPRRREEGARTRRPEGGGVHAGVPPADSSAIPPPSPICDCVIYERSQPQVIQRCCHESRSVRYPNSFVNLSLFSRSKQTGINFV